MYKNYNRLEIKNNILLNYFYKFTTRKISWLLFGIVALIFEFCALYFQHVLKLNPCTLCIYQRCVIFGFLGIGILGVLFCHKYIITRLFLILSWIILSFIGLNLSINQANLQFFPQVSETCPIRPTFPTWLKLDEWIPTVFKASGFCSEKVWNFLTLEMSQWMIIIFLCYIVVAVFFLFTQVIYYFKSY